VWNVKIKSRAFQCRGKGVEMVCMPVPFKTLHRTSGQELTRESLLRNVTKWAPVNGRRCWYREAFTGDVCTSESLTDFLKICSNEFMPCIKTHCSIWKLRNTVCAEGCLQMMSYFEWTNKSLTLVPQKSRVRMGREEWVHF
jgi:hypothetical protein